MSIIIAETYKKGVNVSQAFPWFSKFLNVIIVNPEFNLKNFLNLDYTVKSNF